MPWRWRANRTGPGRPFSDIYVTSIPHIREFLPNPRTANEPVSLTTPEFETIRLLDLQELTQKQAAKKMKTSQGTVWRLYSSARKKIAEALIGGRPLLVLPEGVD